VSLKIVPPAPPARSDQALATPTTVCPACALPGVYRGCQPLGSRVHLIAYHCSCGKVWGFNVLSVDVEKYRS
jgi:hypothetical protein